MSAADRIEAGAALLPHDSFDARLLANVRPGEWTNPDLVELGDLLQRYCGDILHGDLGTDFRSHEPLTHMLLNRMPVTLELTRYATPVPGLYLCGAATHPGGSVIAANGRNAAVAVLKRLR